MVLRIRVLDEEEAPSSSDLDVEWNGGRGVGSGPQTRGTQLTATMEARAG